MTDNIDARHLVSAIREEFANADRPMTVREAAELMGAMAAQHEATLAMFALVLRAHPEAVLLQEMNEARKAISFASETFHDTITSLISSANKPV